MIGEGEYNLNVVKEIVVTDSYLKMDQSVRGCQGGGEKSPENEESDLPDCAGLVITSYTKSEVKDVQSLSENNAISYDKYMKWSRYPPGMKGIL